jgi:quercetin dioxygenase-like cupin family protein
MIEQWDESRDGPLSETAMRRKPIARGYRVSLYVYPPETVFPDHTHEVDKIGGVLSGRFRLVLEGMAVVLGPGDCVAIPRGVVHSAAVVGDEPVVAWTPSESRPA